MWVLSDGESWLRGVGVVDRSSWFIVVVSYVSGGFFLVICMCVNDFWGWCGD